MCKTRAGAWLLDFGSKPLKANLASLLLVVGGGPECWAGVGCCDTSDLGCSWGAAGGSRQSTAHSCGRCFRMRLLGRTGSNYCYSKMYRTGGPPLRPSPGRRQDGVGSWARLGKWWGASSSQLPSRPYFPTVASGSQCRRAPVAGEDAVGRPGLVPVGPGQRRGR